VGEGEVNYSGTENAIAIIKKLIMERTFCEYGLDENFSKFSEKYYNFKIDVLNIVEPTSQ
jgi:hypothetical protein